MSPTKAAYELNSELALVLIRLISVLQPAPYLIKIGAHDGLTTDPVGEIVLRSRKWGGILFEPVPYLAERLRQNYSENGSFEVVCAAVSDAPGVVDFHYMDVNAKGALGDLPIWWDQVGSILDGHIQRYLGPGVSDFVRTVPVPVTTVSEVLGERGIRHVSLMHIDAEGNDARILLAIPFDSVWVDILLFETQHMSGKIRKDVRRHLRSHGFMVWSLGKDGFALHRGALLRSIGHSLSTQQRNSAALSSVKKGPGREPVLDDKSSEGAVSINIVTNE